MRGTVRSHRVNVAKPRKAEWAKNRHKEESNLGGERRENYGRQTILRAFTVTVLSQESQHGLKGIASLKNRQVGTIPLAKNSIHRVAS